MALEGGGGLSDGGEAVIGAELLGLA